MREHHNAHINLWNKIDQWTLKGFDIHLLVHYENEQPGQAPPPMHHRGRNLSGPLAIFIWRIAVAHGVGHSQKPPSDFFHGRAGSPCHFLALITPKTFGSLELITPMR